MRIALCTAVWRRHAVTEAFWANVKHLRSWWAPHDVVPVVAVSDDPLHRGIAPLDTVFCEMPNDPLGAKFNATVRMAGQLGAEVVCIVGSDDLVCERVAGALLAEINRQTPYVGLRDLYFHDSQTGRTGYWPGYAERSPHRGTEPAGCHRLIRREVLEPLHWQLWDDEKNRGMDHSSFRRLGGVGARCVLLGVQDLGGCAIDVKSADNLWTYGHVQPRDLPDDGILDLLPSELAASVRALRRQAVAA
jgi:hypothetical protein